MRGTILAAVLAGGALLGPAPATDAQSAPQLDVSALAVVLTAGGAAATVGSGVALSVSRRRQTRSSSQTQSRVRVTALRQRA